MKVWKFETPAAVLQFHLQHCSLCLVVSPSSGSKWFIFSFQWVQVVQVVPVMASPKDLKVPSGQEETINTAFRDVNKLKHKITFLVKDGNQFPALQEVNNLLALADPSGVFKDLARAQARVKIEEITKVLSEMEAACANLAALVISLGEGLNEKPDLETAVAEVRSTEEVYVHKAREALRALLRQ